MSPQRYKYPRTPHLPFSPGASADDVTLSSLDGLRGQQVVVTEKLDGENTTLYVDGYSHARSVDGRHHPSRDWLKLFWAQRAWTLDQADRICGEYLFARHSLAYDQLETYFYGFSAWRATTCLSWVETLTILKQLDVAPVPVLYEGQFNERELERLAEQLDLERTEGFVVRAVGEFSLDEFSERVAKFVRPGHVQTDEHWMHRQVVPNQLKDA